MIVRSGASTARATVDATSTALRGTLYDASGAELAPGGPSSYVAPINMVASANIAGAWFSLRMDPNGTKSGYVRRVVLAVMVVTAGGGTSSPNLKRFNGATPTGFNAVTVVKKNNSYGASSTVGVRISDGSAALTTTGTSSEAIAAQMRAGNASTTGLDWAADVTSIDFELNGGYGDQPEFVLAPGEGIFLSGATINLSYCGFVEWDER